MSDSRRHVLYVEDDAFLRRILATKLAKEGFDVSLAADVEEGLRLARERRPDLILLDLVLPGMTGTDLLDVAADDERLADVPVIVLSNVTDAKQIALARSFGIAQYLAKSDVSLNEVVAHVKRACQNVV